MQKSMRKREAVVICKVDLLAFFGASMGNYLLGNNNKSRRRIHMLYVFFGWQAKEFFRRSY